MRSHAVQYTVRGVPSEVDRVLPERAARLKISVNQLILDELTKATIGHRQKADFTDLVGRWVPDEAFDEAVESQRTIEAADWR